MEKIIVILIVAGMLITIGFITNGFGLSVRSQLQAKGFTVKNVDTVNLKIVYSVSETALVNEAKLLNTTTIYYDTGTFGDDHSIYYFVYNETTGWSCGANIFG